MEIIDQSRADLILELISVWVRVSVGVGAKVRLRAYFLTCTHLLFADNDTVPISV